MRTSTFAAEFLCILRNLWKLTSRIISFCSLPQVWRVKPCQLSSLYSVAAETRKLRYGHCGSVTTKHTLHNCVQTLGCSLFFHVFSFFTSLYVSAVFRELCAAVCDWGRASDDDVQWLLLVVRMCRRR